MLRMFLNTKDSVFLVLRNTNKTLFGVVKWTEGQDTSSTIKFIVPAPKRFGSATFNHDNQIKLAL